jgi:hypothetical protein
MCVAQQTGAPTDRYSGRMNPTNFKTCQQPTGAVQMGRPVLCGRQIAPGSHCCETHHPLEEHLDAYWALHKEPVHPTQMHLL